jgi:hypothetical protein
VQANQHNLCDDPFKKFKFPTKNAAFAYQANMELIRKVLPEIFHGETGGVIFPFLIITK